MTRRGDLHLALSALASAQNLGERCG